MKLSFCGANRNVTGSRHLLTVNGKNVLLDCGLVQGHRQDADAMNRTLAFDPATLDAVVLSHAHVDHCGALPVLLRHGFRGKVYGSSATLDIVPLMLRDCAHIQESDALTWNKRHKPKDWITPLYTMAEAEAMDATFVKLPYDAPREIVPGLTVTLLDAGHILGSSIIVADLEEAGQKRRVTYSGDLGRTGLPILRDPATFGETDVLLLESTYGDREHEPYEEVAEHLGALIRETAAKGGKIIIPAFALERSQEIVYLLHQLHDAGKIPEMPIVIDSPLAGRLLDVFMQHTELYDEETRRTYLDANANPFAFTNFRVTQSTDESKALNASSMPMIIISASGMCESGRILHHLKNYAPDARNAIVIVGYMAEGTTGRKLLDGARTIKIFGEPVEVHAKVVKLGAFSAHADWKEQLAWLEGQTVRRAVYLVHGEDDAAQALQTRLIAAKIAPTVEVSTLGTSVDLLAV